MNRDVAFSLGILALSGLAFLETFRFPEGPAFRVGPEVYPRIVIGVIAALSLLLLGRTLVRQGIGFDPGAFDPAAFLRRYGRTLAVFAVFGLYALLLPVLGFLLATMLFLLVEQLVVAESVSMRRVAIMVVIAVGASAFIYLMFTWVLGLYLP